MTNGVIISKNAPNNSGAIWVQPIQGGFDLHVFFNGKWQSFKPSEEEVPIIENKTKTSLKVNDIEALTNRQCNALNVGDQIIKIADKKKYLYVVTYKEDKQGLCISYADAEKTETVIYNYDASIKKWECVDTKVTFFT